MVHSQGQSNNFCQHLALVRRLLSQYTHTVHIDSVRVSSGMLVRLDEPRRQRLGNEVEADELSDAGEHLTIVLGALVDAQHHRRYVAEYRRAHQRYTRVHIGLFNSDILLHAVQQTTEN